MTVVYNYTFPTVINIFDSSNKHISIISLVVTHVGNGSATGVDGQSTTTPKRYTEKSSGRV